MRAYNRQMPEWRMQQPPPPPHYVDPLPPRSMSMGALPTGAADDDFLMRLSIAEQSNDGFAPPPRPHTRGGTKLMGMPAARQHGLTGVLKPPQQQRAPRRRQGRRLAFHPQVVTAVADCALHVDRKKIPCLAFGGVNPWSDDEEKFVKTKMTVKQFRSEIGKRDPAARTHFNSAAEAEARFRAFQLTEVLAHEACANDSARGAPRARGARRTETADPFAERHYHELLGMQQSANKPYLQRWHALQQESAQEEEQQLTPGGGGSASLPYHSPPPQSCLSHQQQGDQRFSTRVVEPPGGRSSFVFG